MYGLKPNVPDFEVVDGPFAGRKYKAGETYQEIPPEEKEKFEVIAKETSSVIARSEETKQSKDKIVTPESFRDHNDNKETGGKR